MRSARLLAAATACALVCACSTSVTSSIEPVRAATQVISRKASSGSLLFVSDAIAQQVRIYDRSRKTLLGSISIPLPGNLATDSLRNLYVAGLGGVAVYPAPYQKANLTYSMPADTALAVAVASNRTVAAIDARTIYLFAQDSPHACAQYTPPNYDQLTSIAFDNQNHLLFSGYDTLGNVAISEMTGRCGHANSTQLTVGNTLRSASAIAVGSDGRPSVLDTSARTIFTYNPPAGGSLGSPISSTSLARRSVRTPVAFAFDPSDKSVYAADSSTGQADEFSFPGGAPIDTLTVGGAPVGIAIVPPYLPKAQ